MVGQYLFEVSALIFVGTAVPLGIAAAVGFVLTILLAVTQLQEQTLTYLVKFITISAVLFAAAPTIGLYAVEEAIRLYRSLASIRIE
jgi:type III secretory pathway component EscS